MRTKSHAQKRNSVEKCQTLQSGRPMAANSEPAPKPHVGYVISKELLHQADRIQNIRQRASMVHQLLCAYRLTDGMTVIEPELADEDDIRNFHSGDYVDYLASVNGSGDLEKHDDDLDEYGLGFDCPLVSGILDLARTVAGASLSAARALCQRRVHVAINWCGGWHHAQRDGASGFCYVNDAVLAIGELRSTFDRVLYVDLDIHHGDGVENAFLYSSKVFTYSIHHYEDGYFPGTGSIDDVGCGRGRYFCCNVPLKEGATDDTFFTAFDSSITPVLSAFRPDALVIQCGADGLAGDPLGTFGLTPAGLARCVHRLLGAGLPTMLLGGGGYNAPNVARCWAQLTALVLGRQLSADIPDHQFFMRYGPSFDLDISAGLRKDHNTPEYIQAIVKRVKENMEYVEDALHQ